MHLFKAEPSSASMPSPAKDPRFPTTSWSVIQEMASSDPEAARMSFGSLLEQYRYPIYVFIRAHAKCSHEDAEDHLQSFFVHLMQFSGVLSTASPDQGSLRSYLVAYLRNYLANEQRKSFAAKRDVRRTVFWDSFNAEERYRHEPVQFFEPSALFEREWGRAILRDAHEKARARWASRLPSFDELLPHLSLEESSKLGSIQDLAKRHDKTSDAIATALSRLRRIWRHELLNLIKTTLKLPTDEEAKTELEYLLSKI